MSRSPTLRLGLTIPRLRAFAGFLLLTGAYVVAGKAGLRLATVNESATAVWPPTAIALSAVLLFGSRTWPAIFLGAFLTNETTSGSVVTSLLIASGNTLESLCGAALLKRFAPRCIEFRRVSDIFTFAVLGGLAGQMISATIGVASVSFFGGAHWSQVGAIWSTWWLGDATGAIVFAPILLLWIAAPRPRWTSMQWAELVLVFGLLTILGWIVFVVSPYPLAFICLPIVVWAGFRFGPREAATATGVLSLIAVWGTIHRLGSFQAPSINEALLMVQSFIAVSSMVGLAIGAAASGRRLAEERLQHANDALESDVRARTVDLQSAVDRLTSSESRLAAAQRVARVGSWEWRIAENRMWWSDELYRMFGLDPASFSPTLDAFLSLVHPDDRAMVDHLMQRAIAQSEAFESEQRMSGPDATNLIVQTHAHLERDVQGQAIRMLGTAQDITERKGLEGHLAQSRKLEAVGRLAGGIAHDFNNLLTAIGGFTALVELTFDETDPRRADLSEVRKAAERAAGLTRQLLAFGRRQILRSQVLDINALVAELQTLLRRTIPASIDIRLELAAVVEPVRADPGQLEQVLLNLAINAADAMPRGGQLRLATAVIDVDEVTARQRAPRAAGRYVQLCVSDTGTGLSPQTRARMFEPFFTTKDPGKGTGLGLATVYGIIKQSGGFIWVTSELGAGTTFEILLPVVHASIEPIIRTAPVVEERAGHETILVAEDDGAVRRLTRSVLTTAGYTVLDAGDGDDALSVAHQHPGVIHLLLTDMVMPGLSGRDLADRLLVERPDIRVLYTSGYAEQMMPRAGFQDGLLLLAKPFSSTDLLRKVREVLEPTPSAQDSSRHVLRAR